MAAVALLRMQTLRDAKQYNMAFYDVSLQSLIALWSIAAIEAVIKIL